MAIITNNSNAYIDPQDGGYNGEMFMLTGSNIQASVVGLSNNFSFVYGSNNSLLMDGDGGGQTIVDLGQHTSLIAAANQVPLNVYDFQFDQGGSFTQMFTTTVALQASMRSDGHGGTMVGLGKSAVDFVGDSRVQASQLHGIIPV